MLIENLFKPYKSTIPFHLRFCYALLPPAIRRMTEGYIFSLSTFRGGGGPRSQIFWGGSQVSDFSGGGGPVSVKGKNFDTRFGLIHVQTGKKKFCRGTPPPPIKGKYFDTRFGLIHVQTGKKIFLQRDAPPPPVKGKIFDTRFGLIHVQTGKKNFCQGTPPHPE